MDTFDSKFMEMKSFHFSSGQKFRGFLVIGRMQKPSMYLKIGWELFTTFIVYSPGVNNFSKEIIPSIRNKWEKLSIKDQENVIAALTTLNKHGEIEKALKL